MSGAFAPECGGRIRCCCNSFVDISSEAADDGRQRLQNGLDKAVKGLKAVLICCVVSWSIISPGNMIYYLDPLAFTKSGSTVKNAIRG